MKKFLLQLIVVVFSKMELRAPKLVLVLLLATAVRAQDIINIGFIYSGSGQYVTAGVQPAVKLAVDLVNNNSTLLPGYQLNISYTGDSQCDPAQSQNVFLVPQLSDEPGPDNIALLGCGCSLATGPIAQISQYWNMIHMSYASSSDVFSERERYPNFWRTYPPETNLVESVLALVSQYNWRKLKIITQDEPIFSASTEALSRALNMSNIMVDREEMSSDLGRELDDVFTAEIRVYMLNMYPRQARRVYCEAVRAMKEEGLNEEFSYEQYAWITLGWYGEEWWTLNNDSANCTDQEVEQFLPNTIAVLQANMATNDSAPTDVLLTAGEFTAENDRLLMEEGLRQEHSAYHAYDAVWTLAFAMDRFIMDGGNLANYSRRNDSILRSLQSYLLDTNFTGVSGRVLLNENGTRISDDPIVLKYRDSSVINNCGETGPEFIERESVGSVDVSNASNPLLVYSECENDSSTWPEGIPVDGVSQKKLVTILEPLVIAYYCLATVGLIFAFICLLFNLIFRNRKIVKLISPNLNYVITFGCALAYAAIFFFVFPSLDEKWVTFACHARLWLQGVGYFSTFGVILFKMFRVYYIFKTTGVSKKKRARIPKDWQLFLGTCGMVFICCFILIVVAAIGKYQATEVVDKELPPQRDENGVLLNVTNLVCSGPRDIIWIAVLYGYIVITHIVAVILAFLTRKVEIKALNDYKYISVITYVSFVILVVLLVCAILLDDLLNIDAAVFSGLLWIFCTVVLALVFIPKMVILYKDPKGDRIFQRSMSQAGTIIGNKVQEDESDRYLELEQHCKSLEGQLAKCGEVVPTFRPRRESSFKLRSTSFSSMSPSSPSYKATNPTMSLPLSASVPSTPTHTIGNTLNVGTSDYFTEPEVERNSTASSTDTKMEGGSQ